jgi:hypothetical protein
MVQGQFDQGFQPARFTIKLNHQKGQKAKNEELLKLFSLD